MRSRGRLALGAQKIEVEVVEPEGFGPRSPVWDQAFWLKGLRRVPQGCDLAAADDGTRIRGRSARMGRSS